MSLAREYWQIQGSKGDSGDDGADGTSGQNAFTSTTASFFMPAEAASVTVGVSNSDWAAVGMNIFVEGAGTFRLDAKPSSTQMTLTNLRVTASSCYTGNVNTGTNVGSGKRVCPGGLQGPAGT